MISVVNPVNRATAIVCEKQLESEGFEGKLVREKMKAE